MICKDCACNGEAERAEKDKEIAEFREKLKLTLSSTETVIGNAMSKMIEARDKRIAELEEELNRVRIICSDLEARAERYEGALRIAHECIVIRAGVRNNDEDAAQDREEIDRAITMIEEALGGK